MTSWADALRRHSPDQLHIALRQEKEQAEEKARVLGEMLSTLDLIVGSDEQWQNVNLIGPASSPAQTAASPLFSDAGAGRQDVAAGAQGLANRADVAFGACSDAGAGIPPQRPEPAKESLDKATPVTRRARIIALMVAAPQRWWSAIDLCAEIGVDSHRKLRGILSDMVRSGQLIKHKEPGRKNVYYRLAPEFAQQQEAPVSG
ncbi:hypothetical protein [Streptantibioticus ferralitis]|uniref:Uncharacterized protein n=1 Tax=Streptantibioticus ferralitis TaxID=236510 RepID=A0ABT5Z513_9ACTN|nr:hypothetical protein [Streptantibioticus ferralitis]MDF2258907.1 hypothetical protein [Streptantibioticus ferralitis]